MRIIRVAETGSIHICIEVFVQFFLCTPAVIYAALN